MMNNLNLNQIDGGNTIKQGDFGSMFSFELQDENYDVIDSLNGKTATVRVVKSKREIVFETEVEVTDNSVTFNFDKVIDVGYYTIEIIVDKYVFPSNYDIKLTVTKSSTEYVAKELVPINIQDLDKKIGKLEGLINSSGIKAQVVFEQQSPASKWIIEHNLSKYPSVTIIDSAYNEVLGDVVYISTSKLEVHFSSQFSGKAILN